MQGGIMAKRIPSLAIMLAVTIVLAIFAAVFAGVSDTSYALDTWADKASDSLTGSGTQDDPYEISSGANLAYLAEQVNGGTDYDGQYFKLTQNINLNNSEWTPIGKIEISGTATATKAFNGIFDGGGCTVSNVAIRVKTVAAGLFGYVGTRGSVKNLTVSGLNVTFGTTADDLGYAGAIAYNEGAVTSVTVKNLNININAPDYFAGGVVGYNAGTVSSCTLTSVTEAKADTVGGIAGTNDGTVTACLSSASITSEGIENAGGIVGINAGTVTACLSSASITSEGIENAGGIIGTNEGGGTVGNCLATGELKARQAGGIAAQNTGSITTCAFYGKAEGVVGAAGIAYVNNGTVSNSLVAANVKATGETVENEFVEGAVYATASNASNSNFVKYLTPEQGGISADEMMVLTVEGWSVAEGRLPVPESLAGNTSATEAALLSEAKVVTLDDVTDETFNLYNGWYLVLPAREKTGFSFDGWKEGESSYGPGAEVEISENTAFTAQWVLNEIVFVSQSEDISKVYDGTESTLEAEFTHELTLTYEWFYRSSEEGPFEKIDGANASSISLTNVSSSGTYYCVATVSADGLTVNLQSGNFTVVISKADYTDVVYPYGEGLTAIDGGVYTGKKLADFSLAEGFFWVYPETTATVDVTEYLAYYNLNADNYNDYSLRIGLTLQKADYTDVVYPYGEGLTAIDGGVYTGKKLADFSLAEGFFWVYPETTATVDVKTYEAFFNADPVNYNDYALSVTVNLEKGTFTGEMLPYIPSFSVTYDPETTLDDIVLPKNVFWQEKTEKPVVSKSSYQAYFNSDPINYNDYSLAISVTVSKAEPVLHPSVAEVDYYEGNALPEILSASGDTAGTYVWGDYDGLVIGEKEYAWTFTPDDENYNTASGVIKITAIPKVLVSLTLDERPSKTEYYAFEYFSAEGAVVKANYNDGTCDTVTAYTLRYQKGDSFRAGDTFVILTYEGFELIVEGLTVNKIVVSEPSDETEYVYDNGNALHFALTSNDKFTLGGVLTAVEAGAYTVTVTLNDPDNYRWRNTEGNSFDIVWVVAKYKVSAPTVETDNVYDGKAKESGVSSGLYYTASGILTAVEAGTYELTVALKDKANTCWADETTEDRVLEWTIAKKKAPLPETLAVQKTYYYNGEMQTFEWVNADGIFVSGEKQTDAGQYEVKFNLISENYTWVSGGYEEKVLVWRILPKEIAVPTTGEREFVYIPDTMQELVITKRQEYVVSGNTAIDAGEYTAVISLVGGNYCWTGGETSDVRVDWQILPLEVAIPVMGTEMPVYCGETVYAPVNKANYYTLSGNTAVNAGSYVVTATLKSKNNYVWEDGTAENKTFDWEVVKKTLALPIYNGNLTYDGSVQNADITVDGSCVISGNTAKNVGEYTAEIRLKDANYVWADGSYGIKTVAWAIVPFKVNKPVVLGDSVYTPSGQYAAISESEYYTLSGNFALVAGNYTATASLKDKTNFTWQDSTVEDLTLNWKIVPAKVFKPENVRNLIYTGSEQTAEIHVSELCDISGNKAKDAGTYTATVSLKDSVNYTWEDGTVDPVTVEWNIYTLSLSDGEDVLQNYVAGTPLPSPQKENYFFDGWYASPDFSGERIYSLSELDEDTVLYAKWSEMPASGDGEPEKDNEGLPVAAIVGIAVACVCAAAAIAIIIIGLAKKNKIRREM